MQNKTEVVVGIFVLAALAVFAYMGFQIGAFRLDRRQFVPYYMTFKDVTGLSRKALVKIAGVEVGRVEEINYEGDGMSKVVVGVSIHKSYILHSNAYAIVRQDGLLGSKYLEIIPGDPLLPRLDPGSSLGKPSVEPVSVDEILLQVKRIGENIEQVTDSLKVSIGGAQGREHLNAILSNLAITAEKMASFSGSLDRTVERNQENINAVLELGADFKRIAGKLEREIFPAVQDGVNKIATVFDRDFGRVATKFESTVDALEEASVQARDGFRSVGAVADKINEGKGLLGKLVTEDDTYRDLKVAVQGLKNYFARIDMMQIIFDIHSETMQRPGDHYAWEDSKGYIDVRVHPNEDHFYQIEIVGSERGTKYIKEKRREYADACGNLVEAECLHLTDYEKLRRAYTVETTKFKRNSVGIGFQFGKVFRDIAFRIGLFDGSYAGMGVDFDIPFGTDKFRWLMSLEAFDLKGWNKVDDRRPHLKWLNRMYFMHNLYFTFGADDFASRHNGSVFFGAGIRFGDDDIKYYLPTLAGASAVGQ